MRPVETHKSNFTFTHPGDGGDLRCERTKEDGQPITNSAWEPSADERALLVAGAQVELSVWGDAHPPVALSVVNPSCCDREMMPDRVGENGDSRPAFRCEQCGKVRS